MLSCYTVIVLEFISYNYKFLYNIKFIKKFFWISLCTNAHIKILITPPDSSPRTTYQGLKKNLILKS